MPMFAEQNLAWALTRGMARVVEVDLLGAVAEGWFTRQELAALVDRCAACDMSKRCGAWLAVTRRAARLPPYCANSHEIEGLRPDDTLSDPPAGG